MGDTVADNISLEATTNCPIACVHICAYLITPLMGSHHSLYLLVELLLLLT